MRGKHNGRAEGPCTPHRPRTLSGRLNFAARRAFGRSGTADLLRYLYRDRQLTMDDVGAIFGGSRQAVSYLLEQAGVERRSPGRRARLEERAKALGYDSLSAFFWRRGLSTFEMMAFELGFSAATIRRHYGEFLRDRIDAIGPDDSLSTAQ